MRAVFFGHARYSAPCLRRLAAVPGIRIAAVVTRHAAPGYTDFCSLAPLAAELAAPTIFADEIPKETWSTVLRAHAPDAGFAFGWATVLKRDVIDVFPSGIVGYHPAPLPRNRGHHPIVWALALGLEETASTLFLLDEGIDTGDIVSQRPIAIRPEDDAGTLYERLTAAAADQIAQVAADLFRGALRRTAQDHARASIWRRRGVDDGRIDWRMSARAIHALVRALTHPYVGAHCVIGGADVKVWRARIAGVDAPADLEPGRVLATHARSFVVKCGDGAIEILEHDAVSLPRAGACLR